MKTLCCVPWSRRAPDCGLESNEVIFIIISGRGQQLWAVAGSPRSCPQWIFSPGTKDAYIISQDGVILWPVTPSSPHVSQPYISDLRCFNMCSFVHEMRLPVSLHWSGKWAGQGMIESFTLLSPLLVRIGMGRGTTVKDISGGGGGGGMLVM